MRGGGVSSVKEVGMSVYVDPETIQRNGNLVMMWH